MHSIRCYKLRDLGLTTSDSALCPGSPGRTSSESAKIVVYIASCMILPDAHAVAWLETRTHRTSSGHNKLLAHLP